MRESPQLIDDAAGVFTVVGNDAAFILIIIRHTSW